MGVELLEYTKTLTVSMFGGLELSYGDKKICENTNRSKKLWNLLAFMITHRKRNISQSEFIDILWSQSECTNPENALKNLQYRIRNLLEPILSEREAFIISSKNSYHWNNEFPCVVDIELFEDYIKTASNHLTDNKTRILFYTKAINLYKGDFLSNHTKELWIVPLNTHFHNLFLDTARKLADLLEEECEYEKMIQICTHGIQIDYYDEKLHLSLMKALQYQGNTNTALNHYKTFSGLLYKYLGVRPSEELRMFYIDLKKSLSNFEPSLEVIQNELNEVSTTSGAFICDYSFFKEIYRLEQRKIERDGRFVHICLITITLSNGEIPSNSILQVAMERLLEIITSCLRKYDLISRYSNSQYILMLPTCNYIDCNMVVKRIIDYFFFKNSKSLLRINYTVEEIKPLL